MIIKVDENGLITHVYDNPVRDMGNLIEVDRFVADVRSAFYKDVVPRYRLIDGQPQERTQEEMDADYNARPAQPPSDAERITALEDALTAIEEGIASV